MNDIVEVLFNKLPKKIQIKALFYLGIALAISITIWIKNTLQKKF